MSNKNNSINEILTQISDAASAAASGVTDVFQSASKAVLEKYDIVKLNVELSRLQEEQRLLFTDIGRTLYILKSGAAENKASESDTLNAQKSVDRLLLMSDQKQQEIEYLIKLIARKNGNSVCPKCGAVVDAKDSFCSACGSHSSFTSSL